MRVHQRAARRDYFSETFDPRNQPQKMAASRAANFLDLPNLLSGVAPCRGAPQAMQFARLTPWPPQSTLRISQYAQGRDLSR